MTQCKNCQQTFQTTPEDLALYKKLDVTKPTHCHDCRQQRRLAWRNERWMYKRKCDFSGKDVISMYPPDSPHKVYDSEIWWSDKWDGTEYGREFDFSRPFFEQFREVQLKVPRAALINKKSENSAYTNHASDNKNCYMSGCIFNSEDCLYSDWILTSRDCIDCSYLVENNELCYETYYAWNSYKAFYCDFIRECSDCWFCSDCFGCKNCFMCWNLRNKEYCIRNEQLTKEEYEKALKTKNIKELRKEYIKAKNSLAIRPATYEVKTENSIGDLLFGSKNVYFAFDSINVEDARYVYDAVDVKDSMDIYHVGWSELIYEAHAVVNANFCRFCHFTYDVSDLTYCDCTQNCKNLFGCSNLVRKEYCILNKQYTREEYEALVPKIIAHMKRTGEWGEFFPINFSPYAYNQSRVMEYYPLTKEQALAKEYKWSDLPEKSKKTLAPIKQELAFYKKHGLPIPTKHPDERYWDRINQRVPRTLWQRPCPKCKKETWSSIDPDSPANMLCRNCYLEAVY
jgi:hypothetical protein